jgi:tRNA threonylcarbamoyladenosine biosynthesis protein TsaE
MEDLGARVAARTRPGTVIGLRGDLGAGKTTWVRGFLRALGHFGTVKSPTYTLVEPYDLAAPCPVFHFDLYRLEDPGELEGIGIRDYVDGSGVCLIEWPERGGARTPPIDLDIVITLAADARRVELNPLTPLGAELLLGMA